MRGDINSQICEVTEAEITGWTKITEIRVHQGKFEAIWLEKRGYVSLEILILSISSENIRKPEVFTCFTGVLKETNDMI